MIALAVILLIAFGVRVYNLTILPVFADEAIYIRWAQVMKAESTLRFLPLSDGKPPLFMWSVIPFLKIFEDPLFAGRFVSVLTGVGTVLGVFVASYLLFRNKRVALISAFFVSLSPFSVFFDRLSLADSILSFFGIWIFVFGYLTNKYLRLDLAMVTGFFVGFALLTKSPALYFVLLLPSLWLFSKSFFKSLTYFLVTLFIGYVMYNILRLGPNFHLLASRNLDYVYPLSHVLTSPFDPFKPFIDRVREYYFMMGPGILVVNWLIGLLVNRKINFKKILVLFIWFLIPVMISAEFSKTMTARYVLFSVPFFMVIAGCGFLSTNKLLNRFSILLFSIFLFQSLSFNYYLLTDPQKANLPRSERSGYLEEWTAGHGIREIAAFLKSEFLNHKSNIVVGTEGYFGTLPDGLQMYLNDTPEITVIGVGLELDKLPSQRIDYLVANNSRLFATPEELGLGVVKSYPKATKPDGGLETLYLFKVN